MSRSYTVSQRKDGKWYAHKAGYAYVPILGSISDTKRRAQKHAADAMALSLKDYLQQKGGNKYVSRMSPQPALKRLPQ